MNALVTSATQSADAPCELRDPIPPEYQFIQAGNHHSLVFLALAVVVGIFVASHAIPSAFWLFFFVGAGPLLLLGFIARKFHVSRDDQVANIRKGAYLWFWPLTESQPTAYRNIRLKKLRRIQVWCLLLPWVLAVVSGVVFGFMNIIGGRQVERTFRISGMLMAVATIAFGGAFAFWWVWSIPRRAALNARLLPVVFDEDTIFIADLAIFPWLFRRSREVKTIDHDGSTWLSLDFTDVKAGSHGLRVAKSVHQVPIPEGKESEVAEIQRMYSTS